MPIRSVHHTRAFAVFPLVLACGSDEAPPLVIDERTSERITGRFADARGAIEFSAVRSEPLAGEVEIVAGPMTYTLRYDYDGREIVADGHGGALDRPTLGAVRDALTAVAAHLGEDDPSLPMQERMLYAALAMLQQSGGMEVPEQRFQLEPAAAEDASGAVACIDEGTEHTVSFDLEGEPVQQTVTAGADDCNGLCGPGCVRLTPWQMWTLDCLAHDACCESSSKLDLLCWTPLGECGDEYVDAQTDFLRGFEPERAHCGG